MKKTTTMQFLDNKQIDRQKWDDCIEKCSYGLVYARSFYLDNMCKGWKALAGEHYEWVFPISHKTRYAISYLYQPPFTQQLGAFAKDNVAVPIDSIMAFLKQHYRFWEINWNYSFTQNDLDKSIKKTALTNFVLDLSEGYESISANYHNDLIKNLKRSKRFELKYEATQDCDKCIGLFKHFYRNRLPHVKEDDYKNFRNVCNEAQRQNMIICRQVVNKGREALVTALLLTDGKRLYNLMNATSEAGRRSEANHFLIDSILKEFSGKNLVFDFEGSDVPGVKRFYQNFGPTNLPYFMIRYNQLPWPLHLFKK